MLHSNQTQSFAFSFQIYFKDKKYSSLHRLSRSRTEVKSILFSEEEDIPGSEGRNVGKSVICFDENRFDISAVRFLRWYTIHGPITAHISQVPAGFRDTDSCRPKCSPLYSSSSFPPISIPLSPKSTRNPFLPFPLLLPPLFPISFLFLLFLLNQPPFLIQPSLFALSSFFFQLSLSCRLLPRTFPRTHNTSPRNSNFWTSFRSVEYGVERTPASFALWNYNSCNFRVEFGYYLHKNSISTGFVNIHLYI